MSKLLFNSLIALTLLAGAAEAGTKKITLNVSDLEADGVFAQKMLGVSVAMPDGFNGAASIPIVLPPDYKKNSTIKVDVLLSIDETGCNVTSGGLFVLRARKGKLPSFMAVSDPTSGLTNVGVTNYAAPAVAEKLYTKRIQIAKATGGGMLDQKAGDTLTVLYTRAGTDIADTCTHNLSTVGAIVTYQTN